MVQSFKWVEKSVYPESVCTICLVFLLLSFSLAQWYIVQQSISLAEYFGFETSLFKELSVCVEEHKTGAPLGMQVNTARVLLIIWASGQENTKYSNNNDLWYGLISSHMPLIKAFNWMRGTKVEPWSFALHIEENLHIFA